MLFVAKLLAKVIKILRLCKNFEQKVGEVTKITYLCSRFLLYNSDEKVIDDVGLNCSNDSSGQ